LSLSELVERTTRLAQVLSQCVPILYKSRAQPTLAFCAAAIAWLHETKLEPATKLGDNGVATAWKDAIFNGLMEPIHVSCYLYGWLADF
jgi:hypothetical protein